MAANNPAIEVSFIIPLYNTGSSLTKLFEAFSNLPIEVSYELILVNDASPDGTGERVLAWLESATFPVIFIDHARNYGEHAAVMSGYRQARGKYIINLDDDLQNPISEALKILTHLQTHSCEVVYTYYAQKKHHWFRNFGSWLTNYCACLLLDKPRDLYLCSFRGVRRELVERLITYTGPYPYVDGLILGATNRIDSILVDHHERPDGQSGYTLRKLLRLWMNMFFNFSVMPLRLASALGVILCAIGILILVFVLIEYFFFGIPAIGWASLMAAITIFSGAQLLILGLVGEYLGRTYMTLAGKPQAFARQIIHHQPE